MRRKSTAGTLGSSAAGLPGRNPLVLGGVPSHHLLGAIGIDNRLGVTVHQVDLGLAAVAWARAPQGGQVLSLNVAPDFSRQRIEPMVGLRNGPSQSGDAMAQQDDHVGVGDEPLTGPTSASTSTCAGT